MNASPPSAFPEVVTGGQKLRAYAVHLYTASVVVCAFLAAAEICALQPDPRRVFVWLAVAGLIDATEGLLARRWQVKSRAPQIAGRPLDDIGLTIAKLSRTAKGQHCAVNAYCRQRCRAHSS